MKFFRICKNTDGTLAVEAAIFLPIFIIGVLTLVYLIKFVAIQENVFHSFNDEVRKTAAYAVNLQGVFLEGDIEKRIDNENPTEVLNTNATNYTKVPSLSNGVILAKLEYDVRVKLPVKLVGDLHGSETIMCKAFTGGKAPIEPMPFNEMEQIEESETVWVFPRSGTKYHAENCSYIAVNPKEKMLSSSIRGKYDACKLCKPGSLSNGNMVYCFNTGNVYHRGSCTTVDRYVESMQKDEAIERGFSPCSKCGGG